MKKVLMVAVFPLLHGQVLQAEENMQIAAADTVELESISVTGKTSQPVVRLKRSPITSTVIDKAELDKVKFTNTTELLNRIPGVSKSRNLRIPVGGKGYTIPLVDGFSLRNPYRGSVGQIDDTNTTDIERIEVIYGPGSALYGSNAFGGVINVITREPPEEQENRVWIEVGDHDRLRSGFATTGTITETSVGDIGYLLDANRWDIGGYRDDSDDDRSAISGKLVFHPTAHSKLWFRGEYIDRHEKGAASLTQAEFDADRRQNKTTRSGVVSFTDKQATSASVGYSAETDHGEFRSGLAYRHEEGFSITSFGGPGEDDLEDMDFKTQYRHDFKGFGSSLMGGAGISASLTGGLELVYSKNEAIDYTDPTRTVIDDDQDIKMFTYAPFVQLEVMPTEKAKVTLGLRYEKVKYDVKDNLDPTADNERTFSNFSPKLGFTYDITPDHMAFAGISQGFASPSRSTMFRGPNANPDLEFERATNYEMGMRGSFDAQRFSYDFGLYYLNVKDYIVSEPVGRFSTRSVNAGKVNIRGLEAQLEYEPVDYLRFGVSYTYARNKFQDFVNRGVDNSGNFFSSSPEHHINSRVTVIPAKDFEIELEMDSYSSSYTSSANDSDPDGKFNQKDVFNLRANYETGPVELWFTVLNLTDEKYATRASFSRGRRTYSVGDGRSLYIGAGFNF